MQFEIEEDEMLSENEEDYEIEELNQITEEDEKALSMFMSKGTNSKTTLADIIMEKIRQKEGSNQKMEDQLDEKIASRLDPKVVKVYKGVGKLLTNYSSGKVPKAFKIVPSLSNWEEILYLTQPENWSAVAVRQATRIFASNLNAKMAQRFYNLVLLPRIRQDIQENKKLNFHLYLALKKALYKPSAFFKGILLPMCEEGDCTLREATIISSVLKKVSVPVLHSGAALLKIAQMKYSGANSLFITTLLNKKYALPYRVIDAMVEHFSQFKFDERKLPLLWQQSLLTFIQRYKTDLTQKQKEDIKALVKVQYHPYFSEEVRREIGNSPHRGQTQLTHEIAMTDDSMMDLIE